MEQKSQLKIVAKTCNTVFDAVTDIHVKGMVYDAEDWSTLPCIPDDVFQELPPILQRAVSVFDDKRERDTFFTGALVVLSGLFNGVQGTYQRKTVYPNLYCFIVAPASSGKGSMPFAKKLGIPFHSTNNDKLLFLPANISVAALYQELDRNEGAGIFFESEADTMAASHKQEWGDYSDILRNAFHHDSLSLKRKDTARERHYIEIPTPKLSVAISGTKNQLRKIIPNTEDGLFSRFLFYTFRSEQDWKRRTDNEFSLDDFFKELATEMPEIVNNLISIEKFDFTEEQWCIFDEKFSTWLDDVSYFHEDSPSIIKRMGLITFRIAMILSLVRQGSSENNENEAIIYCDDIEFYIAMQLAETYIHHSLFVFTFLNNGKTKSVIDRKRQQFFDALPLNEFTRETAVQSGKEKVNLGKSTVDKYLKKLLAAGNLIQDNYGKYKKKN